MRDEPTAEPWYPVPEDEPPQDVLWITLDRSGYGDNPHGSDDEEGDEDA